MNDKEKLESYIKTLKGLVDSDDLDLEDEIKSIEQKLKSHINVDDKLSPWQKVQMARHKKRPTTLDYIDLIFDDFIEFHGDRSFRDDCAIVGGIGSLKGKPVTIVGHQKGKNVQDNIKRNFGMAHPEGYRKSLRLIKQAEKFKRPVICFIDTPGAYCGIGAEERGQSEAIAKNLFELSNLSVPVISIIIGEGGSGGALAFGVADEVWMLENTIYSILSPEGFSSILWKDASKAKIASEIMKIVPEDLSEYKIIDRVISEPATGAHSDIKTIASELKDQLYTALETLQEQSSENLIHARYDRYRKFGVLEK